MIYLNHPTNQPLHKTPPNRTKLPQHLITKITPNTAPQKNKTKNQSKNKPNKPHNLLRGSREEVNSEKGVVFWLLAIFVLACYSINIMENNKTLLINNWWTAQKIG